MFLFPFFRRKVYRYVTKCLNNYLKGTVAWDFRALVFVMKQYYIGPWATPPKYFRKYFLFRWDIYENIYNPRVTIPGNRYEKNLFFVNISAKTKIFWDVDLGPRYYRFRNKNQSSKISYYCPFNTELILTQFRRLLQVFANFKCFLHSSQTLNAPSHAFLT